MYRKKILIFSGIFYKANEAKFASLIIFYMFNMVHWTRICKKYALKTASFGGISQYTLVECCLKRFIEFYFCGLL